MKILFRAAIIIIASCFQFAWIIGGFMSNGIVCVGLWTIAEIAVIEKMVKIKRQREERDRGL